MALMSMSADQVAAELQRKKNLGIAPTSTANNADYNKLTAQPMSAGQAGVGGAAAGAFAGLPGGTVPQPSIPSLNGGSSGGGGWMGVPNAINIAQASNPISAAAAAGGANVETNYVSAPPTKMSSTVYEPPTVSQPMSANQAQSQAAPATDYAALAATRTAASLARKTTISQQQKAAADASYNQQTLRTNDNRLLENAQINRTLSPFAGKTTYDKALIGRERTQADADSAAALATQKGNIDALLADYQNATAEEQIRIADELERADKQYQLQLAQLTGNIDGQQTLGAKSLGLQAQGQAFDQGIAQAGLTGTYNGQKTLQSKQLDRNNFESDRSYNLAKATQDWSQTFQTEQYTDQKAQQLWDNSFKDKSFAQSMSDAAASRGLQWASLNQRDKEYIADSAFREKSFNADQEQRKIENLKSGTSDAVNKEIDGLYTGLTSGQITGSAAIQEIDGRVNAGLLNKADADRMKSVITTVTSSQPNVRPSLTQDQIDSNGGNNPQDLNSAQLDKLWKTDPTGKAAGRPSLDWAAWYTDPRGKVGGISFEAWRSAYGPQIKG